MTPDQFQALAPFLSDPAEGPLLRRLLIRPDDEVAREAYYTLLASHDDPRAPLLRPSSPPRSAEERAELAESLVSGPLGAWWVAVRDHAWTLNCAVPAASAQVRFATACRRDWRTLAPTSRNGVRFCEECVQPVYECLTREDAERHALAGGCVAIPTRVAAAVGGSLTGTMTGRPHVPSLWGAAFLPDRPALPGGLSWALRARLGELEWEDPPDRYGPRRFAGGEQHDETGRTRWVFAEGTEAWVDLGPVPDNLTVRLAEGTFVTVTATGPEFQPTGPFERPGLPWARLRAALVADGLAPGDARELKVGVGEVACVTRDDAGWCISLQAAKSG